jgi:hypothetical protein
MLCCCCLSTFGADDNGSGNWYKGNLHTHSLWSDGNDFPELICEWYRENGYQFLGLSDHNILSRGEKWVSVDLAAKRGAIDSLRRYKARFGESWVETREVEVEVEVKPSREVDQNPEGDQAPEEEQEVRKRLEIRKKQEVRLKSLDEFRPLFDRPGEFLLIQCEEVTDHFASLPIHINASNVGELIRPQGGDSLRETIKRNLLAIEHQQARIGQPILAHLNHPNFGYAVTAEDMAAVVEEKFFEIYNGHPGVAHLGDAHHVSMERMWDIANTIRTAEMNQPPLYGLATDDSHNYFGNRDSSPGRGWVMVRAPSLDAEEVIQAIKQGDFYASSGVTLEDVRFDGDNRELTIEIKSDPEVTYQTEFIGTLRDYDKTTHPVVDETGKEIRATRVYSADVGLVLDVVEGIRPQYKMTGNELYMRAVVTSTKAHPNPSFPDQREQAWTQPIVGE